jgi:hypothetical protein
MSLAAIVAALHDALKRSANRKKQAADLRQKFHWKVAAARAVKYNTTIETQEKLTHNAFRQKSLFASRQASRWQTSSPSTLPSLRGDSERTNRALHH